MEAARNRQCERRYPSDIAQAFDVTVDSRLTEQILGFLERDPSLEFSPADVAAGIGVDGDVSSILRSLATQGRVVRVQRGIYRCLQDSQETSTT